MSCSAGELRSQQGGVVDAAGLGVKVGTWKHVYNSINLVEDNSIKDKSKVMKSLIQIRAATQKQLDALNERNLIP